MTHVLRRDGRPTSLRASGPEARKRTFPPDVVLGISVGSITALGNVVLLRGFVDDSFSEPRALLAYAVAGIEALLSAAFGLLLVAAATALALNSRNSLALHRTYAVGKLILFCVAVGIYPMLVDEPWSMRWARCGIAGVGALYPISVLLGLRRARAEWVAEGAGPG